jgi:G8 domain-containing protein
MTIRALSCAVLIAWCGGFERHAEAQVIHTPNDHVPNFAASPSIRSVTSGSWSSPATWSPARVPGPADIVSISHTVRFDGNGDASIIGIDSGGTLRFSTTQSTWLRVGTLMVLPGGSLEVGTEASPVEPEVTAQIVIADRALDAVTDPDQFGTGLIVVDGTVTLRGALKQPTFARVSTEPRAGQTTVTFDVPMIGWRAGDRLFLPDTRQVPADHWFDENFALQIEERTIQSVDASGRSVTLSAPLSFDHRGARDADGTPSVVTGNVRLLPHVGNLTRNVIIRSENPFGTRGHAMFTHRSRVSIQYAQFQDLGRTRAEPLDARTNHIGRYPLHIHHLWGPSNPSNTGYQFQIVGNAINDSRKWPIAVHGSHYGLIKQNVVFGGSQLTGAGIAVEDGTETENLFEENFVANIRGSINPRQSGPSTADGTTPGSAAECFWAAGFNNRFINNVAASCRNPVQQIVSGPGWKFIVPAAPYTARNPRFRGADMSDATQTVTVTPQHQAILEFRGNEVYGLAADGLTAWELGTDGYAIMPATMPVSLIKDFRVWHTYEGAVYNYPAHRMSVEGLVYRVDRNATQYWPSAFQCGDYRNIDITIVGGSIHAGGIFGGCTDPLGIFRMEGVDAVTWDAAFFFETPATPGTGASRPASGVKMVLRNNQLRAWPGRPLKTIETLHTLARGNAQPDDPYEILVYDYQGKPGNDFRVYFHPQATTNLYGGLAPCSNTTARPEIDGITCSMTGTLPGPTIPTGLRVVPSP